MPWQTSGATSSAARNASATRLCHPRGRARRRGCCARSRTANRPRSPAGSSRPPASSDPPGAAPLRARSTASGSPDSSASSRSYAATAAATSLRKRCTSAIACCTSVALLAALESELVLAQRLRVVALLPEREPQIEVRELAPIAAARPRRALWPEWLERQVGLRAGERRIESDRALGGCLRFLVSPHVAEHEAHQVVRVRIVRHCARSPARARRARRH